MKILTFVDTHGSIEFMEAVKSKAKAVDLLLCAGDITVWGNNLQGIVDFFEGIGKPCFIIHGNHETEEEMRDACKDRRNVRFIHKEIVVFKGFKIVGFGGGGFSSRSEKFERWSKELLKDNHDKTILVTHGPPYKTSLDAIWEGSHAGNKSYREFIEKTKPLLAVSGHIHETWGATDEIGKTIVINPGPEGLLIEV